jgi:hypothetical protein
MSAHPSYGLLDRLLHKLAFNSSLHGIELQKTLADIEDAAFTRQTSIIPPSRPVFITALPRAGTTLMLSALAALPEFATHTYRDMPFVLCPLLWNKLSRAFRKPANLQERAHGDGVAVGYDSPEAFEEILWMAFWSEKYRPDQIATWSPEDRDAAFEAFFARHMNKIIALREAEARVGGKRYLSKNNANIARLTLLPRLFPDCRIVIPFRDPWSHAMSLLRQHERFSELHQSDPFARRYMSWLGHFEFGAEFRPIRFPNCAEVRGEADRDPQTIAFWLHYWISSHEAIIAARTPNLVMVDYEMLCINPVSTLDSLTDALNLRSGHALAKMAGTVRVPRAYAAPADANHSASLQRAYEIFHSLREYARACSSSPPSEDKASYKGVA